MALAELLYAWLRCCFPPGPASSRTQANIGKLQTIWFSWDRMSVIRLTTALSSKQSSQSGLLEFICCKGVTIPGKFGAGGACGACGAGILRVTWPPQATSSNLHVGSWGLQACAACNPTCREKEHLWWLDLEHPFRKLKWLESHEKWEHCSVKQATYTQKRDLVSWSEFVCIGHLVFRTGLTLREIGSAVYPAGCHPGSWHHSSISLRCLTASNDPLVCGCAAGL